MSKLPIASVTVRLDLRTLSGEQLADLVQQVVEARDKQFVIKQYYHDGDLMALGQTSDLSHEHIRIVPSHADVPLFSPDDSYSSIKVVSHNWGGEVYPISYTDENWAIIDAVKAFAGDLTVAYEAGVDPMTSFR